MIVLDACALIEMARGSTEGRALRMLYASHDEMAVSCDLARAEVASVCRKLVRAGGISAEQAGTLQARALAFVDDFHSIGDLEVEALRESIRLDHSSYDLFYFVLARRLGATLLTTDRKLMRLCTEHGVNCVAEVELTLNAS